MPTRQTNSEDQRRRTPQSETNEGAVRPTRVSNYRQNILFVDSQDPNSRSAVQRHTAYHSNAQRRESRLRSLRNVTRPRFLGWLRRSDVDRSPAASVASSNSSNSNVVAALVEGRQHAFSQSLSPCSSAPSPKSPATENHTTYETEPVQRQQEDWVQNFLSNTCPQAEDSSIYHEVVAFILTDQASTHLLRAYIMALRNRRHGLSIAATDDEHIRDHLAQGTNLLRERLGRPETAASNESIQAVLLLIAYSADFDVASNTIIHARGLRSMLVQRGGLENATFPSALMTQLRSVDLARRNHLTVGCNIACDASLRFAQGLPEELHGA